MIRKVIILILILFLCGCIGTRVIDFSGILGKNYINSDCVINIYHDSNFVKPLNFERKITKYEINDNGEFMVDFPVSPSNKTYFIMLSCIDKGQTLILHKGSINVSKGTQEYYFGRLEISR